jgi:hypothetical protein
VLLLPMGSSDDGAHSQNEKINTRNYIEGVSYYSGVNNNSSFHTIYILNSTFTDESFRSVSSRSRKAGPMYIVRIGLGKTYRSL